MELKINELMELIREQVELFEDVGQSSKTQRIELDDWIPKIQISGEWGEPKSKSRAQIDKFVSTIPEEPVDIGLARGVGVFERKLQGLINLVRNPNQGSQKDLGSIFAKIVILDILHAIIAGIADAGLEIAAGKILESFCAAMAGGQQLGKGNELTDFIGSGINYSLKLDASGKVKGAFSNLYAEFGVGKDVENPNAEGFKEGYFIRYIVFNKNTKNKDRGIEIFAFDLDNESFPILMNEKGLESFQKTSETTGKSRMVSDPHQNRTTQHLFNQSGTEFRDGVTFQDIVDAKVFKGKPNLGLTRNQIVSLINNPKMEGKVAIIAQLPNIEEIKDEARKAAEQFKDVLIPVYKSMKDLTDNLNDYFLGVGRGGEALQKSSAASIRAEKIVKEELPRNFEKTVSRETSSPVRGDFNR